MNDFQKQEYFSSRLSRVDDGLYLHAAMGWRAFDRLLISDDIPNVIWPDQRLACLLLRRRHCRCGWWVGWISGTSRPSRGDTKSRTLYQCTYWDNVDAVRWLNCWKLTNAMINVLSPLSQTANIFCTALCQAQPPQMFEPKLGLGPSTSVLSTKYTSIIYQVFESNKNLVA